MWYCNNATSFWWVIFPVIWGILILFFILFASRFWWGRHWRHNDWHGHGYPDPLAALKHRYARGEITKAEYEEIKKDLAGK